MFIGSLEIEKPSHTYRVGSFGGSASIASLIITDWFETNFVHLKKKGAIDQWYITVEIDSAVIGIKETKIKISLSTKEKHFDLKTPVRVECIGIALDGIKMDGKLLLNQEGREDPRFDPRNLISGVESKSHIAKA